MELVNALDYYCEKFLSIKMDVIFNDLNVTVNNTTVSSIYYQLFNDFNYRKCCFALIFKF